MSAFKGVGEGEPWADKAVGSATPYRFDLLPPDALAAVAELRARAVAKHGEAGINDCYHGDPMPHLNKALVHAFAYLAGDTSERGGDPREHLVHALFRMLVVVQITQTSGKEEGDVEGRAA